MLEANTNKLIQKLGLDYVDEQDPLKSFQANPSLLAFTQISKQNQTTEMVQWVLDNVDPRIPVLKYISKRLITHEICLAACSRNSDDLAHVPKKYLDNEVYYAALQNDGLCLWRIPEERRTFELCYVAVQNDQKTKGVRSSLEFVPSSIISSERGRELCCLALQHNSTALKHIPEEYLNAEMCLRAVLQDGTNIRYVPCRLRNKAIYDFALAATPESIAYFPYAEKTEERCANAISRCPNISQDYFPEQYRAPITPVKHGEEATSEQLEQLNDLEPAEKYEVPEFITFQRKELRQPKSAKITDQDEALSPCQNQLVVHDIAGYDSSPASLAYYITDLHLEYQLKLKGSTPGVRIDKAIQRKLKKLIDDNLMQASRETPLLIGGDVADNKELAMLFYHRLRERWSGPIFAVLGNHELWSYNTASDSQRPQSIDNYISNYGDDLTSQGITLIENALAVQYKGVAWRLLDEATLMSADANDLSDLCNKATCLILGGLGFSGRNPLFNASTDIYCGAIDADEDKKRSERFNELYKKILSCASERQVIVLTHTPKNNWSEDPYNPNWIYINGHTHRNAVIRLEDGTTVLSDNQIGYKPKTWYLHSFTRRGTYDPFADWESGLHQITREQYIEFNRGRGISMAGFKWPGKLYVVKQSGYYMFLLSNGELYLLEGGRRHIAKHNLLYYHENMGQYAKRIEAAFRPYREALDALSKEVQAFGGSGIVHGCIVDIDFYDHIYLNPFDGTIVPYHAESTDSWNIYPDVPELLSSIASTDKLLGLTPKAELYEKALEVGNLPLLTKRTEEKTLSLATVPSAIIDPAVAYKPSRIMRGIQYALDQNVVRIWNDNVLDDSHANTSISSATRARIAKDSGSLMNSGTHYLP